jgi:glutamate N-acetyltransferase/amino-acid N-acetyltransferase
MSDENNFKTISGSICAPRGFKAAAVLCDIKKLGTGKGSEKGQKRDLALIVSDVPAAVAGMFTTNQVCAAPVKISAPRAAKDFARVIVVNSGNANACTGRQGLRDAEMMARKTAIAVAPLYECRKSSNRATVIDRRYRRITGDDVLVCSTGRIGMPMPMKNVERGIRECAPLLARSTTNARQVAEAIMTTDTRRKEIAVEFKIDNRAVRIGGICKGAGMIEPGMTRSGARHATMLGFVTSDAAIESNALKRALEAAVGQSFNRISVDGDMSTNDSVIMLANGLAGNPRIKNQNSRLEIFRRALAFVTLELAKMIVRDAEGATRLITLHVRGAHNAREAEAAARAIVNSTLVKTSWCGGDPNWGRILCALGYSRAKVDESIVDVGYGRAGEREIAFAFRRGRPTNVALNTLAPQFDLHVDLHAGAHDFVMYASDLTEDYVALNKGGLSDPSTLGG